MKDFLKPPYSADGRRPYIVAKCGMERYITAGKLDGSGGCFDWPAISVEEAKAIREYIVRACNCHDELLKMCVLSCGALVQIFAPKDIKIGESFPIDEPYRSLLTELEAAIKKAKGK